MLQAGEACLRVAASAKAGVRGEAILSTNANRTKMMALYYWPYRVILFVGILELIIESFVGFQSVRRDQIDPAR